MTIPLIVILLATTSRPLTVETHRTKGSEKNKEIGNFLFQKDNFLCKEKVFCSLDMFDVLRIASKVSRWTGKLNRLEYNAFYTTEG